MAEPGKGDFKNKVASQAKFSLSFVNFWATVVMDTEESIEALDMDKYARFMLVGTDLTRFSGVVKFLCTQLNLKDQELVAALVVIGGLPAVGFGLQVDAILKYRS